SIKESVYEFIEHGLSNPKPEDSEDVKRIRFTEDEKKALNVVDKESFKVISEHEYALQEALFDLVYKSDTVDIEFAQGVARGRIGLAYGLEKKRMMDDPNLFKDDPLREKKIEYIVTHDQLSDVQVLSKAYEAYTSNLGLSYFSKHANDIKPSLDDLKSMTMTDFLDIIRADDTEIYNITGYFPKAGLAYDGNKNAYTALYELYLQSDAYQALLGNYGNDPTKVSPANIRSNFNTFYTEIRDRKIMQSNITMGKNVVASYLNEEQKKYLEDGLKLCDGSVKLEVLGDWPNSKECLDIIYQNKVQRIKDHIRSVEDKVRNRKKFDFNIVPELNSFNPKVGKDKNYDNYIALHSGTRGIKGTVENIKENLAKCISAKLLKKDNKGYSKSKIRDGAKKILALDDIKNLSTESAILMVGNPSKIDGIEATIRKGLRLSAVPLKDNYSQLYKAVNSGNTKTISPQEADRIINDFDLNDIGIINTNNEGLLAGFAGEVPEFDALWGANHADRIPTRKDIFQLWALGVKGVKVEDVNEACKNNDYINEFKAFCKDNPIGSVTKDYTITVNGQPQVVDGEKLYKESVVRWQDVIDKALVSIKSYKIPNIDFSNPNEVKKHLSVLYGLQNILGDFSQEFSSKFFKGIKFGTMGSKVVRDSKGSAYDDAIQLGADIQMMLGYVVSGYGITNAQNIASSNEALRILSNNAACRIIAGQFFNEIKGKTFEEALETIGNRKLYELKGFTSFMEPFISGENVDAYPTITEKAVLDYYSGKDKETLTNEVIKYYNERVENYKEKDMPANLYSAMDSFRSYLDYGKNGEDGKGSAKEALLNLGDRPEDMIDFLDNYEVKNLARRTGNLKGEAWVESFCNDLFKETRQYTSILKVNDTDLLLIDGKTPSELWGQKYQNVAPAKREYCYKAEFLKKIAECNSLIQIKDIKVKPDNSLELQGAKSILMKKNKFRQIHADYQIYVAGRKAILDKYKNIKKNFLAVHVDKKGNKLSEEKANQEFGKVGIPEFKNVEKTLDKLIAILGNNNANPNDIRKDMDNYYKALKTYDAKVTKIPKGNEMLKYTLISTQKQLFFKDYFALEDMRNAMGSELLISAKGDVNHVSDTMLRVGFEEFERGVLKEIYELDNNDVSEVEAETTRNQLASDGYFKGRIIEELSDKCGVFIGSEIINNTIKILSAENYLDKDGNADVEKVATLIASKEQLSKFLNKKVTTMDLQRIESDVSLGGGEFQNRINEISNNKIFKDLVKNNPKQCALKWVAIENTTDKWLKELNNQKRVFGKKEDAQRYVEKGLLPGAAQDAPSIDAPNEVKTRQYERLSELVYKQILTAPGNKYIAQAVKNGNVKEVDVLKETAIILNNNKVIGTNNFDWKTIGDNLANGNFKRMVEETIKNTVNTSVNRANENAINAGRRAQAAPKQVRPARR
nr:hypothetical protein [Lachnospiraceae bacterium]